jgi:hypothetical protein
MNGSAWRVRMLLLIMAATGWSAFGPTRQAHPVQTPDAIDQVLAPQVTPAFQSQVLVLGTSHLSAYADRLEPRHLDALLDRLERFAPTRIAVESLTADEIALLEELETHDPAAARILDMFARGALAAGQTAQEALGLDRADAALRARATLADNHDALTDAQRLNVVGWLVAAYELNSAALQWSYLTPEARQREHPLPTDIRDLLDRRLHSANEVVSLATPLARRLGIQWLHSIDSQYDGVRTLSAPTEALQTLFGDPARGELMDRTAVARADSIRDAAFADGDLLPLYQYINSPDHQLADLTQWNWLFQNRHPDGLDRFRYAMWEIRNLRQATHIVDVAASGQPDRLLVIVGSSHKAYLDRLLATQLSIKLVQLEDLET